MKMFSGAKIAVISALFALLPGFSLSALPEFTLSGGGGFFLGGLFTDYIIDADENNSVGRYTWMKMTQEMQQFNFGGFIFFDATYGELAITVQHGINAYKEDVDVRQKNPNDDTIAIREGTGSETMLGFTLLGKYPFYINERFLFYPLAGAEYQIALVEKRTPKGGSESDRADGGDAEFSGDFSLSMWNSFFIKIGAGTDFYFRPPWFFKAEFLYSFRLMTPYEKEAVDYLKRSYGISDPELFGNPGMRGLTHGPELRLAVGYRFL